LRKGIACCVAATRVPLAAPRRDLATESMEMVCGAKRCFKTPCAEVQGGFKKVSASNGGSLDRGGGTAAVAGGAGEVHLLRKGRQWL